jgi:hypothetical protein
MVDIKFTKEQVNFESPAKGMDHCGDCKYFLGGRCKIVYGTVTAGDWCKKFAPEKEKTNEG